MEKLREEDSNALRACGMECCVQNCAAKQELRRCRHCHRAIQKHEANRNMTETLARATATIVGPVAS